MKKIISLVSFFFLFLSGYAFDEITPEEGFKQIACFKSSQNQDTLAVLYGRLAEYYASRNADSTYLCCQKGLELADRDKEFPYIDLLLSLSNYYNAVGESRKCADVSLQALYEAERLHTDSYGKGNILSVLGVAYRRLDMPDSALICYNHSLECFKEAGEQARDDLPFLLTSISILYANTLRLDEAEKYIRQAIASAASCEDLDTQLYISNSAGGIFMLQKKFDEARTIMLQSLHKAEKADRPRAVLQCISPLLSLFLQTGDFKSIDRYVSQMAPWLKRLPPASNEVLGFKETMAMVYTALGRYHESNECYDYVLKYQHQNAQALLYALYVGKARNYVGLRQLKPAADMYERTVTVMDSLHQSEVTRQLSEFSVKYETQTKELEISRLNEETLAQKNLMMKWGMILGGIIVLCLVVILQLVYRKRRVQQEAELKAVRSFIDGLEQERGRIAKELHDGICNDLLGVGMLLQMDEGGGEMRHDIVRSLETIRADVRYISHELTPPRFKDVTLDEVLEECFSQLFSSSTFHTSFRKSGDAKLWKQLPESVAYEVYRIAQELTGNIIHHAEATEISASVDISVGRLVFSINNNGKEYDPRHVSRTGIGQNTVSQRVQSLGATMNINFVNGAQQIILDVPW